MEISNEQLVERIQRGERNLINELYRNCRPYICKVAAGMSGCHRKITGEDPASSPSELLYEDLCQQSYFALVRAADGWNPEEGTTFLTYFARALKGEFWRYMAECGQTVKIPTWYRSALYKLEKADLCFRTEHGAEPTPEELAQIMEVSVDQVIQLRDDYRLLKCGSLDEPIGEEEKQEISDLIPGNSDTENAAINKIHAEELSEALWPVVAALPGKEGEAVRLRYQKEATLEQIGEQLSVCHQRADALVKHGVKRLREDHWQQLYQFYCDDLIEAAALHGSGVGAFCISGSSSTERTALMLDEIRNNAAKRAKRSRARL